MKYLQQYKIYEKKAMGQKINLISDESTFFKYNKKEMTKILSQIMYNLGLTEKVKTPLLKPHKMVDIDLAEDLVDEETAMGEYDEDEE